MSFSKKNSIMTYHHVGDNTSPYLAALGPELSLAQFRSHMEFFANRYRVVPFSQLGTSQEDSHELAITIDDGYLSVKDVILPIIEEFQVPVKVFLNQEAIDRGHLWLNKLSYLTCKMPHDEIHRVLSKELDIRLSESCGIQTMMFYFWRDFDWKKTIPIVDYYFKIHHPEPIPRQFLNAEDIDELSRHHLFEFGSHSRSHYPLHKLPVDVLWDEVVVHHRELQERFPVVSGFAVPFGFKEHITPEVERCITEIDDKLLLSQGGQKISGLSWKLPAVMRFGADRLSFLT